MRLTTGDPVIDATSATLEKQTLSLARAVRSNIQAQEYYLQTQIEEGETILGILRQKADEVALILQEADKQIVGVRGRLDSAGVPLPDYVDPQTARNLAVQAALYGPMETEKGDWNDEEDSSSSEEDVEIEDSDDESDKDDTLVDDRK